MKCRRKVCNSHNAICRHTQTNEMYCPKCAKKINQFNPGLVEFPPDLVKDIAAGHLKEGEHNGSQTST
jgi:hypothetical protein